MDKQLYIEIKSLSDKYASELRSKIDERTEEMKSDDNSHFLIYRVLGISESEGNL
ncbi:ApaLI family restriction endonuclease, partial [Treponema porcinum]|uniref:ApaLI family restriction endonuclease n=1 Tax=Treponema porcinum TaxID=261392 RepID=UPI003C6FF84A